MHFLQDILLNLTVAKVLISVCHEAIHTIEPYDLFIKANNSTRNMKNILFLKFITGLLT